MKGLYTNSELVETIINDLNNVLRLQMSGQYVQACCNVAQMAQKLVNLRKSIDNDMKSRDRTIEALKAELKAAGREVTDIPDEVFNKQTNKKDVEV